MRNPSRIFALLFTVILVGCASNGPTYRWVKIFEGQTPFEQASAQCDYEAHLQDKADARADAGSGIGYILMGMPHPTKAMCMRRFGWEARQIERQEQQSAPQAQTTRVNAEDAQKADSFREAAERGDPVAQVNLAYIYLNGYGVNKSNALAYKWYTKAASQYEVNREMALNAQANLGFMWRNGLGLKRDNIRAMMWFLLASSTGWEEAIKRKKDIEPIMLEREIEQAKRLANLCIDKKYIGCDD